MKAARGEIVATTDADCILPPDWIERIQKDFKNPGIVQVYGPVYPIEEGIGNQFSLFLANTFSRIGYYSRTFYYTLGCNTAFRREAFVKAGMYRCIDAGDDLEISMRRYQKFGTIQSLHEWMYIVSDGGESGKYSYTRKKYK